EAADAGRGGLPRGGLARAERGADLGVVEVVAVAEHDRRLLLRRQRRSELGELLEGRHVVVREQLRKLPVRLLPAGVVEDDPPRDREHPGAQMQSVLEPRIGAERAQERLLERVVGAVAADPLAQEAEHLLAVGLVERLERRDGSCDGHRSIETYASEKM